MEKRKKPKFLRRDWKMKIRFGKRKKLKWRWTGGRHNKIREKKKNRPRMPTIGYRNPKEIRYLIQGLRPVNVSNERELGKVGKDEIVILSSTVGMKKRIEIAKKYSGKGIKFMNFNPEKLLIEIKKNEPKENKEGEKK